jgi:hypothetical protein
MDAITINNLVALLEECMINGNLGSEQLYAWYLGEKELIKQTVLETRFEEMEVSK